MKTGDKLIATDPCVMHGYGTHALTVGKEYRVLDSNGKRFTVIDDDGEPHHFETRGKEFFKPVEG